MALNLEEMRDAVRVRVGVPASDSFFDQVTLDSIINEALQHVSLDRDWPWLDETTTFVTVSGTQSYVPPADWLRTKSLIISTPTEYETLQWRSLQEIREIGNSTTELGLPYLYTIYADEILLAPAPAGVYTFRHDYIAQEPQLQANTDEPRMPEQFRWSVVQFAVYLAQLRQGDMARAQAAMQGYNQWLERMHEHTQRVTVPLRVRVRRGRDF